MTIYVALFNSFPAEKQKEIIDVYVGRSLFAIVAAEDKDVPALVDEVKKEFGIVFDADLRLAKLLQDAIDLHNITDEEDE